jgi:hypothetical protein
VAEQAEALDRPSTASALDNDMSETTGVARQAEQASSNDAPTAVPAGLPWVSPLAMGALLARRYSPGRHTAAEQAMPLLRVWAGADAYAAAAGAPLPIQHTSSTTGSAPGRANLSGARFAAGPASSTYGETSVPARSDRSSVSAAPLPPILRRSAAVPAMPSIMARSPSVASTENPARSVYGRAGVSALNASIARDAAAETPALSVYGRTGVSARSALSASAEHNADAGTAHSDFNAIDASREAAAYGRTDVFALHASSAPDVGSAPNVSSAFGALPLLQRTAATAAATTPVIRRYDAPGAWLPAVARSVLAAESALSPSPAAQATWVARHTHEADVGEQHSDVVLSKSPFALPHHGGAAPVALGAVPAIAHEPLTLGSGRVGLPGVMRQVNLRAAAAQPFESGAAVPPLELARRSVAFAGPTEAAVQRAPDPLPAPPQAAAGESAGAAAPTAAASDVEKIAKQVYEHLRRRLLIDQERRGR